ncbi:MAG: hypothetical protein IT495_07175, partial [Gammaproteobacteria bacterium]|nr:hypothetical protein [Gammaproteobacteria bacterium]
VGATVLPVAGLYAPAPATVRVMPADVVAGYLDCSAAIPLEIRSNTRGYVLDVAPLPNPFREVRITGLDAEVMIGRDGGQIVQRPGVHPQRLRLQLRCRFALEPGAAPGEYPWPLQLRIQPLAP